MNWRRIVSWLWVFLGGWAMVWYWRPHLPPWWAFLLLVLGCFPPVIPELVRDGRRHLAEFRRKHGLCLHCGYSLAGNVSGVCPECGTPAAP